MLNRMKHWPIQVLSVLLGYAATIVGAAQPGDLMEWPVASAAGPVMIRFRYCPAGTIRPGRPTGATTGSANVASPVTLRDFYIGETEVTLDQFRKLLGETGMAPLKEQAAKNRANPQLLERIQNGTAEPAFFVDLDAAVDFCNHLQDAFDSDREKEFQPSLGTRLFRLPSHVEWQYAARAINSAENQSQRPDFALWIPFSDLSPGNQQKCQEIWKSLGNSNPFPDSQDAFLELSRTSDAADQEKLKDVLTEAFTKAFGASARSASGIGTLQRVGMTRPNAWNLTELHDGVTEWTLWSRDIERTQTLWSRLAKAREDGHSLIGQDDIFLAGGSFNDSYFGAKALNRFTIWGGPKLTDEQALPFAFKPELVLDYMPGFRVFMEQVLDDNWMLILRQSIFQKRRFVANAEEYLRSNRAVVDDLTDTTHTSRIAVEFYTELLAHHHVKSDRFSDVLVRVAQTPTKTHGHEGGTNALDAFVKKLNQSDSQNTNPSVSDDEAYFRTLATLVTTPGR